jgi:hypothetical protein
LFIAFADIPVAREKRKPENQAENPGSAGCEPAAFGSLPNAFPAAKAKGTSQ